MCSKSIYRSGRETISGEERISVAVLDPDRGGKAVPLATLAKHLPNHDPLRWRLLGLSCVLCGQTRMACELATAYNRRVSRDWSRAPERRRRR